MDVPIVGWIKAVATVGAPAVVAVYFTWWVTGTLAAKIETTNELLRPHVQMSDELRRTLYNVVEIQRIQCVNDADTPEERRACLRAGVD